MLLRRKCLLLLLFLCLGNYSKGQITKLRQQSGCLCNLRHRPVCTSDGEDYPNACSALCAQKVKI